jgi:hypothetical protein
MKCSMRRLSSLEAARSYAAMNSAQAIGGAAENACISGDGLCQGQPCRRKPCLREHGVTRR